MRRDLGRRLRHERHDQVGGQPDGLDQVVHHCLKAFSLVRLLGEHPGRGLLDVLIAAIDRLPDQVEGRRKIHGFHVFVETADGALEGGPQLLVQRHHVAVRGRHFAVEVALQHRQRPVDKVSEVVGQVGIEPVGHRLPADVTITVER